jgi:hypothetical protein
MSDFKLRKIKERRQPVIDEIVKDLGTGSLFAFVGAGVSANKLNGSKAYGGALARVEAELEFVSNSLAGRTQNMHTRFIDAFSAEYLNERRYGARQKAEAWPSDGIIDCEEMRRFRVALTGLIVYLTERFNEAIKAEAHFYFSGASKVDYEDKASDGFKSEGGKYPAYETLETLSALTQKLEDELAAMRQKRGDERKKRAAATRAPPRKATQHQLETACALFAGIYRALFLERYDASDGRRQKVKLHSDHIAWLSDILWLSIVVWLPFAPTARELATELALVAKGRARSAERRLIRTAECFTDPGELATYIEKRFDKDNRDAEADCLIMDSHAALASTAVHAAQFLKKEKDKLRAGSGRRTGMGGLYRSVVFTTNFDRGIEMALEKIITASNAKSDEFTGYRMVYPVLVESAQSRDDRRRDPKRDATFDLLWAAHDWLGPNSDPKKSVRWILDGDRQEALAEQLKLDDSNLLSPDDVFDFKDGEAPGPVVVKLHGAPLEPLGNTKEDEGEVRHYLVISEHQYIDAILKSQFTAPDWLRPALQDRNICFLGYSIEDWNVRLHLARTPPTRDDKISREGDDSANIRHSAIVQFASDAEKGLYQRLGIGLAAQELGSLVHLIHKTANKEYWNLLKDAGFDGRDTKYLDIFVDRSNVG